MGKAARSQHDGDTGGLPAIRFDAGERPPPQGHWRLSALDAGKLSLRSIRDRTHRYGLARCCGAILSFMSARTSGGAVSGDPALNGGAGLYSSLSWMASAACRLSRIETSVSAKSIPAVTPPPVMRLRSTQTRVFAGVAPNGARWSIADQCVAAR